jgi:hypothetical protein
MEILPISEEYFVWEPKLFYLKTRKFTDSYQLS